MDREVQRLRESDAQAEVVGHVKWGDPASAVLHVAVDRMADLLVLGSVGRTGLAGVLLGNTAERVLREVNRSLLVVKPEGFRCPVPL
jgi:nucleotide-binding universal stress UspA family protein